jgi:Fe2+ transport system protein FeoA
MSVDDRLFELLELARTSEMQNRPIELDKVAIVLKCSVDEVKDLLETAVREGLVQCMGGVLKLTDKGRVEVQRHREHYIHEKYSHKSSLIGRIPRFLEGSISDWHAHWRHKHGFDDRSLNDFYRDIQGLEGRVEETSSLADLGQGERGIVAFALGGHGLVRRLAEMGLTPGTEVKVVRSAPFHGPIEILVRGVSLALGRGVASKVFVKQLKGES